MNVEDTGSALRLPGFKSQFQVSSCVMSSGKVLLLSGLQFSCYMQSC